MGNPAASVLVPFRTTDDHRKQVWELISSWYMQFEWAEVLVGTDDGGLPFSRSAAINDAAGRASTDTFIIADSDTWLEGAALLSAIEMEAPWVKPWADKVKLCRRHTEAILGARTINPAIASVMQRRAEQVNHHWCASPLVVSREAFERVGGMDEGFRGWGGEEEALGYALRAFYGRAPTFKHTAWHLWHPRIGRAGADLWEGQVDRKANGEHLRRYKAARTPDAMEELLGA